MAERAADHASALAAAGVVGRVTTAAEEIARAASDLGHIVRHAPAAVVHAASPDDVVRVVAYAASARVPLAVRGSGHTTFGQAQARDGLVLDLAALARVTIIGSASGDVAHVESGAKWSALVAAALPHDRSFAVLPDFLALSVGGTLASGGIGEASFRAGTQTDHVRALDVVTGTGARVRCSRDVEPELFDACRAGMGQFGVVLAAELELVPAPRRVALHTLRFASADTLLAAHVALATHAREVGVHSLQGSVDVGPAGGHIFTLNVGCADPVHASSALSFDHLPGHKPGPATIDLAYADFLRRIENLEQAMHQLGVWDVPHPWAFLVVPASHAAAFLRAVSAAFQAVRDGRVLVYLMRRAACATPNFMLPDADVSFVFGLLHNAHAPRMVDATLHANGELFRACAAVGGKVYPVGAVPLTAADWRRQLGPRWEALRAAKARFDPAGVLAPGVGMFGA